MWLALYICERQHNVALNVDYFSKFEDCFLPSYIACIVAKLEYVWLDLLSLVWNNKSITERETF